MPSGRLDAALRGRARPPAKEGAHILVVFLEEQRDANETKRLVKKHGSKCLLIKGDVGQEEFCRKAVALTVEKFGGVDVIVNNAAEQHPQDSIEELPKSNLSGHFGQTFSRSFSW